MAYKKLKLWFDEELARLLADKICEVNPDFDASGFVAQISRNVDDLELKPRVELIADKFHFFLGENYLENIAVLRQILGPENENETGMFKEYYWIMPIAKYVEKYGLDEFEASMEMLREITKRNTSEYTIRPYILKFQNETLSLLKSWTQDDNRHIRRLCSEGIRPRLPWASKLDLFIQDPTPLFPILDALKDDPSRYVQKSVANCINDVLKDNPEIGKSWIESWRESRLSEARKWIIRHALRNLKKVKDDWALSILGE
jgi:3-methyladenine DNA glycosylase AlkC